VCDLATVHDFRGNELSPTRYSDRIDQISKRLVEGISSAAHGYGNVETNRIGCKSILTLWMPRKYGCPETTCVWSGNPIILIGVNPTKQHFHDFIPYGEFIVNP